MSLGANYSGEKKYGDEQPFPLHTPDESRKAILHNADAPEKKPMTIKRETSQISAAAIEHYISEVNFDKQSEANGIISTAEKRNPHALPKRVIPMVNSISRKRTANDKGQTKERVGDFTFPRRTVIVLSQPRAGLSDVFYLFEPLHGFMRFPH